MSAPAVADSLIAQFLVIFFEQIFWNLGDNISPFLKKVKSFCALISSQI